MLFGFVTKHACGIDRQNYDSQHRASIAASRGKSHWKRSQILDSATEIIQNRAILFAVSQCVWLLVVLAAFIIIIIIYIFFF